MLLEEVRAMAQKKMSRLEHDPNASDASKKYGETVMKMLSNSDYLVESPKSLVLELLYFVGYAFEDLDSVYDRLMEELTRRFKMY